MRISKFGKIQQIGILMLVILVSLSVGGTARAITLNLTPQELNEMLGGQTLPLPDEQMLGISTKDDLVLAPTSVVYFGDAKTSGIRLSGGIVQYKNTSGSWSSVGAAVASNGGWAADGTNNRMYPTNNASGSQYPVLIGTTSTSTPATASTVFYVSGESVFTGAMMASSTLGVTGNTKLYGTLAVTGASTLTGNIAAAGTLAVAGATTLTGAATLSSTLDVTGAATFASTLELAGNASTTGAAGLKSASLTSDTGAISFSNENLTTTGTLSVGAITTTGTLAVTGAETISSTLTVTGATTLSNTLAVTGNTTITAGLTVDTSTLIVNSSTNRVGIGSTTPAYTLGVLSTDASQVGIAYDITNYATLGVSSIGDLTITPSGSDTLIPAGLSIGTSTPSAFALDVYGDVRFGEIGSSNAFLLDTGTQVASFGGALTIAGATTLSSTLGIASTTPFAQLGIGAGGNSTSTISTGKFCMYAGQENGVAVYIYLSASAAANQPFATTTTSCF